MYAVKKTLHLRCLFDCKHLAWRSVYTSAVVVALPPVPDCAVINTLEARQAIIEDVPDISRALTSWARYTRLQSYSCGVDLLQTLQEAWLQKLANLCPHTATMYKTCSDQVKCYMVMKLYQGQVQLHHNVPCDLVREGFVQCHCMGAEVGQLRDLRLLQWLDPQHYELTTNDACRTLGYWISSLSVRCRSCDRLDHPSLRTSCCNVLCNLVQTCASPPLQHLLCIHLSDLTMHCHFHYCNHCHEPCRATHTAQSPTFALQGQALSTPHLTHLLGNASQSWSPPQRLAPSWYPASPAG